MMCTPLPRATRYSRTLQAHDNSVQSSPQYAL
ncbi:Uncharacterised protein [Vibrio cholerae]|nr:Uncharacterised protein [Vibrio cholerae]